MSLPSRFAIKKAKYFQTRLRTKASWKLAVLAIKIQQKSGEGIAMSKTVDTNFSDTNGMGEVKLYVNNLPSGKRFYGRFDRATVDMKTLIARIKEKGTATSKIDMLAVVGHVKEEIVAAVKNGEAVNLMDLGTVFISPVGSVNSTSGDEEMSLTVKFTPSTLLKDAVREVKIKDRKQQDTSPVIENVYDQFSKKNLTAEDFSLSAKKAVTLTGTKLKVAGENGGVFLAPVDATDAIVTDTGQWLKSPVIDSNLPKRVVFYMPEEAKAGTKYRIVLRTSYSNGKTLRKEAVLVQSDVVTVKATA